MGTNNHKCSLTGVVPSPHIVVVIVEVASAAVVMGKDNFCWSPSSIYNYIYNIYIYTHIYIFDPLSGARHRCMFVEGWLGLWPISLQLDGFISHVINKNLCTIIGRHLGFGGSFWKVQHISTHKYSCYSMYVSPWYFIYSHIYPPPMYVTLTMCNVDSRDGGHFRSGDQCLSLGVVGRGTIGFSPETPSIENPHSL